MKGISAFIKRIPEGSLTPSAMRGHSEKAVFCLQPGKGPFPEPNSAGIPPNCAEYISVVIVLYYSRWAGPDSGDG